MSNDKITIAVDGPAGSGKSSISKEVARKLSLKYIDSGAVYRSITWFLIQKYGLNLSPQDYAKDLNGISIKQIFNKDTSCSTFVNDKDVSDEIRDTSIADNIGVVSDNIDVRNFVNSLLRKWAVESSVIMDGRDIGTVVFPNAEVKIYLDATVDVRAQRRTLEYRENGKEVDIKSITKQIAIRDKQDKSRPFGRLVKADDAVVVDTTDLTKEEVIKKLLEIIDSV